MLTVGGLPAAAVTRHTPPRHERPRPQNTAGLTGLGDVLDGLLADEPETTGLSTGVAALDRVCGGLARGSVTLVAAPPNAGGSLLPLQAARAAAFDPERPVPVLYALSGVPLQVAARRLIAAEASVPYARFAAGTLTPVQRQAVAGADGRLRAAPLSFTGPEPAAQAIAEEAARIDGLGLVVVDRLQHTRAEGTPLSGRALPAAVRTLARLAVERQAAVVVLLDTDDPQQAGQLETDRAFHLTRPGDGTRARIAVTARDLGVLGTVEVGVDMTHLRLLDQPPPPSGSVAPARTAQQPPSAPVPTSTGTPSEPVSASTVTAAPAPGRTPTQQPSSSAPRAGTARRSARTVPGGSAVHKDGGRVGELVERIEGKVRTVLAESGGEVAAAVDQLRKTAIPDVMDLLEQSRAGGRYDFRNYPDLPDILRKLGRQEADDIWEARPRWTAPPQILDRIGDEAVTALDITAPTSAR
ncbi:DnaB-like helicase C-terminal domain-containing protein [Streptomyces albus]